MLLAAHAPRAVTRATQAFKLLVTSSLASVCTCCGAIMEHAACNGTESAPAPPRPRPSPQQQGDDSTWTPAQHRFMLMALEQAKEALRHREVPIGCVFVRDGEVIATGRNLTNHTRNATRHAELEAVDKLLAEYGGNVDAVHFERCELYVTIEPCIMCAGALSLLGLGAAYFGAANDKFGGCGSIVPVHKRSCGSCGRSGPNGTGLPAGRHGLPFISRGGLFSGQAVQLLQDFYTAGNPSAPKPHRPVLEVRPWEKYEQQQEQKQNQEHQMQRRVEVEADGTRDGLEMRLEAKQQQQQQQPKQQAQLQNGKILHTLNGELLAHALEEQQHSEECLPHKQQRRPQQQPQPQLDGMEVG